MPQFSRSLRVSWLWNVSPWCPFWPCHFSPGSMVFEARILVFKAIVFPARFCAWHSFWFLAVVGFPKGNVYFYPHIQFSTALIGLWLDGHVPSPASSLTQSPLFVSSSDGQVVQNSPLYITCIAPTYCNYFPTKILRMSLKWLARNLSLPFPLHCYYDEGMMGTCKNSAVSLESQEQMRESVLFLHPWD